MNSNPRPVATALSLLLSLLAISFFALLLLNQPASVNPASQSAGYPAPSTSIGQVSDATPALPVEPTAWVKLTEASSMATLSAEATPFTLTSDVHVGTTPLQFLKRPAGDGMLVVQAHPMWYIRFTPSSAWVTKTADKYITVFVGLYRDASKVEEQVVVEFASLKDFSVLDSMIYRAPVQDTGLAIVDASGHMLILHSASGETVWFDAFAQTFNVPGTKDAVAERSVGLGNVLESSTIDFSLPNARVFDRWSLQTQTTTLEVYAGEIKEINAPELSYGRGMVFVRETSSNDEAKVAPIALEAPDSMGALRVFTVIEDKLILVDVNGVAYVFDTQARKFLPDDAVKLPRGPFLEGLEAP